ncbi:MAG: AAA family ATPase [Verrucomicrobiota bacterium]
MLTTLRIRNLALVGDLTLSLGPGYTAVTGETGAGKSVILGALHLVLGQRADRGLIRAGTDQCTVEAVFDVRNLPPALGEFLAGHGLEACEDGQLLLKRTFTAAGSNRQFVNGSPTTLATLEALGGWLVDLHGPHDHQSLLQPAHQLALLDAFGGLEARRADFAGRVRERAALEGEKARLVVDERTYAQQLDLLRFQVREIEDARLQPGEEARLESEHRRAANGARLLELAPGALAGLGEGDDAAVTRFGQVGRLVAELARLDPTAGRRPMELQTQAVELLGEVQQ